MLLTLDLPEKLVEQLDALIIRRSAVVEVPWPFPGRKSVVPERLSVGDRKKYDAWLATKNEIKSTAAGRHSRSAIVTDILEKHLPKEEKEKEKEKR